MRRFLLAILWLCLVPSAAASPLEIRCTADQPLNAGDRVQVTLQGAPGQRARFQVVGVTGLLPMREIVAGSYLGIFVVPQHPPVRRAMVRAWLGGTSAVAPVPLEFARPLVPHGLQPAPGSTASGNRPAISLLLGGSADPASVRFRVAGREVTDQAQVTPEFASYRPREPLPAGPVQVEVAGEDTAGRPFRTAWSFRVPAPPAVRLQHGPGGVLHRGDVLWAVLEGPPGGWAVLERPARREMEETAPGVYLASWQVDDRLRPEEVRLQARLVTRDGSLLEAVSEPAVLGVRDNRALPLEAAWEEEAVVGRTAPGAEVQAVWTSPGGLVLGEEVQARAQEDGSFRLAPPPPPSPEARLRVTARREHRSRSLRLPVFGEPESVRAPDTGYRAGKADRPCPYLGPVLPVGTDSRDAAPEAVPRREVAA